MINRVVLVGRLSKNPDLRKTPNNASVVSFTVAVDNRTKDVNGNKTTSFIPCVCCYRTFVNPQAHRHNIKILVKKAFCYYRPSRFCRCA